MAKTATHEDKSFYRNKEKMSHILHSSALYNKKQFNFYKALTLSLILLVAYLCYFIFGIYQSQSLYVVDKDGYAYSVSRSTEVREDVEVNAFLKDFIKHQVEISKATYRAQREYIRPISSDDYYRQLFAADQKNESLTKQILQSDYAKIVMNEFAIEKTELKAMIFHVTFNAVREVQTGEQTIPESFRATAVISIVKRTKENPFGLKLYSIKAPEGN
jgi:hypothetical protein